MWLYPSKRGKRYNKRTGKNAGRGLIPNRIDISERPAIVVRKTRMGDREGVIAPWPHMPNLIQLVQGTEQALPLYDPVHGSGPGEIVFLAALPTAMIRYMVVVLAR